MSAMEKYAKVKGLELFATTDCSSKISFGFLRFNKKFTVSVINDKPFWGYKREWHEGPRYSFGLGKFLSFVFDIKR